MRSRVDFGPAATPYDAGWLVRRVDGSIAWTGSRARGGRGVRHERRGRTRIWSWRFAPISVTRACSGSTAPTRSCANSQRGPTCPSFRAPRSAGSSCGAVQWRSAGGFGVVRRRRAGTCRRWRVVRPSSTRSTTSRIWLSAADRSFVSSPRFPSPAAFQGRFCMIDALLDRRSMISFVIGGATVFRPTRSSITTSSSRARIGILTRSVASYGSVSASMSRRSSPRPASTARKTLPRDSTACGVERSGDDANGRPAKSSTGDRIATSTHSSSAAPAAGNTLPPERPFPPTGSSTSTRRFGDQSCFCGARMKQGMSRSSVTASRYSESGPNVSSGPTLTSTNTRSEFGGSGAASRRSSLYSGPSHIASSRSDSWDETEARRMW